MRPRTRQLLGLGPHGFHRLCYSEWGTAEGRGTVICVHGLSGNRHDFDFLAPLLAPSLRVVCPDLPGRGDSGWLADPRDYANPVYLADMAALLARLDVDGVDWVGTSLGGILGLLRAAQPGSPIRRLVLNDVGPYIPKAGLQRIARYIGGDLSFASREAAEQHLRVALAPFGALSEQHWAHLCESRLLRRPGHWSLHYDPGLALGLQQAADEDVDLWPAWQALRCPVLLLRGAESDVLTRETAEAMLQRHPGTVLHEFAGVGHAPPLLAPDQTQVVHDWLLAQP